MTDSDSEPFWYLPDGPTLATEAVVLALELERQGIHMERQGDMLKVYNLSATGASSKPDLTPETAQKIRQHKLHLLLLVDYCARDHKKAHQ